MARKTAAWQWVGNYLIEAFAAETLDKVKWAELMREIAARRSTLQGVLVLPGSPVPSATQRAQLTEALGGSTVKAAILSDSALVRTALTAINYFVQGQARAFAPTQVDAAFAYLGVPRDQYPLIRQAMATLQQELSRE